MQQAREREWHEEKVLKQTISQLEEKAKEQAQCEVDSWIRGKDTSPKKTEESCEDIEEKTCENVYNAKNVSSTECAVTKNVETAEEKVLCVKEMVPGIRRPRVIETTFTNSGYCVPTRENVRPPDFTKIEAIVPTEAKTKPDTLAMCVPFMIDKAHKYYLCNALESALNMYTAVLKKEDHELRSHDSEVIECYVGRCQCLIGVKQWERAHEDCSHVIQVSIFMQIYLYTKYEKTYVTCMKAMALYQRAILSTNLKKDEMYIQKDLTSAINILKRVDRNNYSNWEENVMSWLCQQIPFNTDPQLNEKHLTKHGINVQEQNFTSKFKFLFNKYDLDFIYKCTRRKYLKISNFIFYLFIPKVK
ncbi:hypothetical protein RFI_11278 [Reticulomyxa filosa]|uniref:Uncharacterized protein n=1 Tax=Reticulomyxa filosa TaxID=46433 RepID=X6NJF1_RETFI|nr:hypothetical protein RFI_11278 [Reticulomyxa filosa]|eukprot:ETO25859.1 hypothetical protein RFI_11278 [Reticulomyxa filosa]